MELALFITFLSLYFVASIVHLLFCYFDIKQGRRISKPFILFFLFLATYFYANKYILISIACLMSCVGDILMIYKRYKIIFLLAGLSFISEHILNIISIVKLLPYIVPYWIYIIIACIVLVFSLTIYLLTKKKIVNFLAFGFMCFHIICMGFSFALIERHFYLYGTLIFVGYLFYFLSDYLIYYFLFIKPNKKDHFYVMLTYIIAQSLIILSLTYGSLNILG